MRNENAVFGSRIRLSAKSPLPLYTLFPTIVRGGERGRTSGEARNKVFLDGDKLMDYERKFMQRAI